MKAHDLKSWPDYFEPIMDGSKPFDIRVNDRHIAKGDLIRYREFDDRKGTYTGRECYCRVTYLLEGVGPGAIAPLRGIVRGYIVMGLKPAEGIGSAADHSLGHKVKEVA